MGVDGGGVDKGGGGEGSGEGGGGEGGGGEGSGGEGSGGEGGGGESGGGEGGGGNGGCGGCRGGDDGGAQPGANTPYVLHVSGHITAIRSLEASPSGGVNSIPAPACAIRVNCITGKTQSCATISPSDSSEPRASRNTVGARDSALAQSLPLHRCEESATGRFLIKSVHGGSCGGGGGGGCGGGRGGCGGDGGGCGGDGGGGGDGGSCGGDGGDGGGRGEGGYDGGAQPGANTPYALHASGHIAANGSVKDRPAGGTNAVPLTLTPGVSLKGSLHTLVTAASPCSIALVPGYSSLRSAAPRVSPVAQSSAELTPPAPTAANGFGMSVHGDGTCCGGVEGDGGGEGKGDGGGISGGGDGGGGLGEGGGGEGGAVARSTGSHCGGQATPRAEGRACELRCPTACPRADNGVRPAQTAATPMRMRLLKLHGSFPWCWLG